MEPFIFGAVLGLGISLFADGIVKKGYWRIFFGGFTVFYSMIYKIAQLLSASCLIT